MVTESHLMAQNTQHITLPYQPTVSIPLPDNQVLSNFTANSSNTVFTAVDGGAYLITYAVSPDTPTKATTSVLQNGMAIPASIIISSHPVDLYTDTFIVQLDAGDTLALQMSDFNGTVDLNEGVGASLTAVMLA